MSWVKATGDVIGFLILSVIAIVESIVRKLTPKKYLMKDVSGEIVLVTGGANGLGRQIATKLADLGAIVVIWDINAQGLEETKKIIEKSGGTCYSYVCNLCEKEDVYKKATLVEKDVGRVSILINNAGVFSGKKFMDSTDQMIIRTMEVNVMSHFWTVKAFLPAMLKENKGHIVSIASLAGQFGCPKLVDYTASKFAAVGFEEALRLELEAEGYDIKTTVICPYFMRSTGMFEDVISRLVPTLNSNDVADQVITAMRCNDKTAIIPNYLKILIIFKWIFPWKCISMVVQGLVHDAAPSETPSPALTAAINGTATKLIDTEPAKELSNGPVLHQQLTRRVSSSERKP